MKLLVGLGNPGEQYAKTRHNVGFMVLDQLTSRMSAQWRPERKFKANVAQTDYAGQRLIFTKPQTFMNASGEAVQAIANFYTIKPDDIWVIFDDLDTPFGRLRVRHGGSGSGHQGINSLIQHLGPNFWRYKVGISLNDRTKEPSEVYVLKPFRTDERTALPQILNQAADIIRQQLTDPSPAAETFLLI